MEKKRILVIDDAKGFTELVKEILEGTGRYEVEYVNTADRSMFAVREFKPDLVLLDVLMPGMDGAMVAEQIRKENASSKIPIIFISVLFSQVQERMMGSYPFLAKPVRMKELIKCVDSNLPD
ncbi:MAG: response regulator [Candidatus Omnitrophota bacterium]|nr:response regulator [Candidatus Omnitrophota bacterium]